MVASALLASVVLVTALLSNAVADTTTATGPDLSTLMDKYVSAAGGRDVLSKIKSQIAVFGLTLMGRKITLTTTVKAPVSFLEVTKVDGVPDKVSVGFDGKTAWVQGTDGKVQILSGSKRAEIVAQAAGANNSEILADRWPTTNVEKPAETIDGKTYYVIEIQPKGGIEHYLLLDAQTFRPSISRQINDNVATQSIVNEFGTGPTGELSTKSVTTTRSDGLPPITATLRSLRDNVPVSDSIFAPPLGDGSPAI